MFVGTNVISLPSSVLLNLGPVTKGFTERKHIPDRIESLGSDSSVPVRAKHLLITWFRSTRLSVVSATVNLPSLGFWFVLNVDLLGGRASVINAGGGGRRHGSVGMGCKAVFNFTCTRLDLQKTSFWMAERRKYLGAASAQDKHAG